MLSTIIYRQNASQAKASPLVPSACPDFALDGLFSKKRERRLTFPEDRLEPEEPQDVVVGHKQHQPHQEDEHDRVQDVFKLLVGLSAGHGFVGDERDAAAVERRNRKQVQNAQVDR